MEAITMNRAQAEAFMKNHDSWDPVDSSEKQSVFVGLFGRAPSEEECGRLWMLCSEALGLDPWRKKEVIV